MKIKWIEYRKMFLLVLTRTLFADEGAGTEVQARTASSGSDLQATQRKVDLQRSRTGTTEWWCCCPWAAPGLAGSWSSQITTILGGGKSKDFFLGASGVRLNNLIIFMSRHFVTSVLLSADFARLASLHLTASIAQPAWMHSSNISFSRGFCSPRIKRRRSRTFRPT